jgi:hypothetical protein
MMDITGVILRNNLIEWAEKAGAVFHKSSSDWRSHCPLHGGDDKSAFAVYEENGKQHYKCFSGPCGQGDLMDFIQAWQKCDKATAYRILGGEEQPDPAQVARNAEEKARRAIAELEAAQEKAARVLEDLRREHTWLTYHNNLLENGKARKMWRDRGIPDDWQDYWQFGYCPDFTYSTDGARATSPTITIPIVAADLEIVNIRHRLLQPINPKDKYRPDRPGLVASPFIGMPCLGWNTDPILVVEGEIKAAVTYSTIYRDGEPMQVIGIPGKTAYRSMVDSLKGHTVYICFDPDAQAEAIDAARQVGGKVVTIPMKIDDAIVAGSLNKAGIFCLLRSARKA